MFEFWLDWSIDWLIGWLIKPVHFRFSNEFFFNFTVRAQITIYSMDYSSFDFNPVTGYDCRASEVVEALIKARNLDHAQARKAFAVWFANSTDALGEGEINNKSITFTGSWLHKNLHAQQTVHTHQPMVAAFLCKYALRYL